jgi:hypothetical protein
MSLRDKILALKVKTERVVIEEIGGEVEVRGITARQRAMLAEKSTVIDGKGNVKTDMQKYYPTLISFAIFDPETGKPLFGPGDVDALAELPAGVSHTLSEAALRLSGLGMEAEKQAEKNS